MDLMHQALFYKLIESLIKKKMSCNAKKYAIGETELEVFSYLK